VAVFIGTFENKIDRKWRVSVPAPFRTILQSNGHQQFVAFRSFRCRAIEACGPDFMERLNASMNALDMFSDKQDDLAAVIFGGSQDLPFDSTGRIVLPAHLAEYAGITDTAAFVGKGPIFQIWEPDALRAHIEEARERANRNGLTLPMQAGRAVAETVP
jgi:MraZ protein